MAGPRINVIPSGGNFGSQKRLDLSPGVDYLLDSAYASINHTFTVQPRGGGPTFTANVPAYCHRVRRGDGEQSLTIDNADGNVLWETGAPGSFDDYIGQANIYINGSIAAALTPWDGPTEV